MKPAKYEKTDLEELASKQTHLSEKQQQDLLSLWRQHKKLFDGTLGEYLGDKLHIDLMPNAKLVYSRAYPVTRNKAPLLKDKLYRMCEMGVLEPAQDSEWGSPTFEKLKKNGEIQVVSNLIELNKVIKRKHYPLPIIQDLIRKRHG